MARASLSCPAVDGAFGEIVRVGLFSFLLLLDRVIDEDKLGPEFGVRVLEVFLAKTCSND